MVMHEGLIVLIAARPGIGNDKSARLQVPAAVPGVGDLEQSRLPLQVDLASRNVIQPDFWCRRKLKNGRPQPGEIACAKCVICSPVPNRVQST